MLNVEHAALDHTSRVREFVCEMEGVPAAAYASHVQLRQGKHVFELPDDSASASPRTLANEHVMPGSTIESVRLPLIVRSLLVSCFFLCKKKINNLGFLLTFSHGTPRRPPSHSRAYLSMKSLIRQKRKGKCRSNYIQARQWARCGMLLQNLSAFHQNSRMLLNCLMVTASFRMLASETMHRWLVTVVSKILVVSLLLRVGVAAVFTFSFSSPVLIVSLVFFLLAALDTNQCHCHHTGRRKACTQRRHYRHADITHSERRLSARACSGVLRQG